MALVCMSLRTQRGLRSPPFSPCVVSVVLICCSLCAPLPYLSSLTLFPSCVSVCLCLCVCVSLAYLPHLSCLCTSSVESVVVSVSHPSCALAIQSCCLCRRVFAMGVRVLRVHTHLGLQSNRRACLFAAFALHASSACLQLWRGCAVLLLL